jgi:hypothetical protein
VGLIASPLLGPAGNREFLGDFRKAGESIDDERTDEVAFRTADQ